MGAATRFVLAKAGLSCFSPTEGNLGDHSIELHVVMSPPRSGNAMKALLHFLLLVSLLMGLVTQGSALGAEPCPMERVEASMAGMEDCCPQSGPGDHQGPPCSEMALACQAMAGCATMGVPTRGATTGEVALESDEPRFGTGASTLIGWAVPPDTHPPARLG